MYYYASPTIAFRRKSSHSPVSPTSQHASPPMHHPTYSSSLVESPVSASFPTIPRSPHTPAYGESLPLVQEDEARFESVGSQAPLIRDFAAESRGGGSERGREEGEGETEQGSSLGFLDDDGDLRSTPLAPPIKDRSERPIQRIPPAGIHDAYVGRFLSPLDPPAESRAPPLVRSNSAPGVPQTNAPGTSLLPSALADEGGVADVDDCGKPIFEIFDAELVGGAKGMVRALKGHLEEVLKVQEEVGRMHLALEGLGPFGRDEEEQRDDGQGEDKEKDQDEGESVAKRQQGVEEIMDRLGALSEQLRTYHSLGTPKLCFSHNAPQPKKSRTMSVDPAELSSAHPLSSHPQAHPHSRPQPRISPAIRPSPLHNSLTPEYANRAPLPRSHSNLDQIIADTLRSPYDPHSPGKPRPLPRHTNGDLEEAAPPNVHHKNSRGSNLPPLSLREEASNRSFAKGWDGVALKEEATGDQRWVERVNDLAGPSGGGLMTSPVQMVDRSRPW